LARDPLVAERYAKLRTDWLLRGWADMPRALLNWTDGDLRELGSDGLYVAESCDGTSNFAGIAFLPRHNAILDRLVEEGIAEECARGDSIESCQCYRKAENPRVMGMHWSVTGLCNLNCRHCYLEAPSGRYGELSFEDSVRVIEELERANTREVTLTGGEPFLRDDLPDLIEMLCRKRIRITEIYTNGLLLSDDLLTGIRKLGLDPSFQISFDGLGAHDYMRGTDGIEADVIEAIRKVRAAGLPVVVSTALDQVSKECLADTYRLLKGLGLRFWRVAAPQETGNWRGTTTAVPFEDQAAAYEPLIRQWLDDDRPFALHLGGFFRSPGKTWPTEGMPTIRYTPEGYDCTGCREKPYLLPDGALLPCPAYTDTVLLGRMPNILEVGLSEALSKSFFRSVLDLRKSDLLARNEECASCELFEVCGMGCRAFAVSETGDLMAKDPLSCELWRKGYGQRFEALAELASRT